MRDSFNPLPPDPREAWRYSKHRGVSWHKGAGKWRAYARLSGENIHIGLFDTEEAAAVAARAWRAENMPFSEEAA